jgi:hypothetical protein
MPSQTARTELPDEEKEVLEPRDVQIEVVREGFGRPLFLTPKRFLRICRHIEQGESISEACRLELVHYTGFRRHVKRNPKYQRRLKQAEETREEFLREYHIANVRKHAPRNVLASLWWLERRFPNQFALKPVHRENSEQERAHYDTLTKEQLIALLAASKTVEAEAPKGFNQPAQLENGTAS